jgi:hypothetical protein
LRDRFKEFKSKKGDGNSSHSYQSDYTQQVTNRSAFGETCSTFNNTGNQPKALVAVRSPFQEKTQSVNNY